jgi:plasmid stabilization system protein ParE
MNYAFHRISPGLGDAFMREVEAGIASICENPAAWFPLARGIRRYRTRTFPYGIVYTVREDQVLVLAVMHLHRRPGYWRSRRP